MPAKVWRARDLGGSSVVSKPSSNYLEEFMVIKERLHRVAYKDQKRAALRAVTRPEDRLGEDCLTPTGNSAINSKTQNFLKTNAAVTGNCLETWSLLHNYD